MQVADDYSEYHWIRWIGGTEPGEVFFDAEGKPTFIHTISASDVDPNDEVEFLGRIEMPADGAPVLSTIRRSA